MNKTIGITMGDACGVGPEILFRAFHERRIPEPFVVYGDRAALELAIEKLGIPGDVNLIAAPDEAKTGSLNLLDTALLPKDRITIGEVSKDCGAAAVQHVEAAARAALDGAIDAIVTLPINKHAVALTHPGFEGHTEFLADLCGTKDFTLMLASPQMIVTHVSTHVSLREAIERTCKDRILTVIRLTVDHTLRLRGRARLAVAALNPHAGEQGAFGTEEITEIGPAIETARAEGIDAHGPIPSDTLFMKALAGEYDAVVCMYHDQGHIAMKLRDFKDAVNITVGLPIVRTSVDHGTAFDIAYQGKASIENFLIACEMAQKLAAG